MSVVPALENVTLWHERDISHSSVERNIAPDTTVNLDFALHRLTSVIDNFGDLPRQHVKKHEQVSWISDVSKSFTSIDPSWS
jgi:adenylosuccinate lyase